MQTQKKELIEMAIQGLLIRRTKIEAAIAEITGQLSPEQKSVRRTMSAKSRKRMAAAQKRRWAQYHRQHR